jgi:hypothetical protein
VLEEEVEVPGR